MDCNWEEYYDLLGKLIENNEKAAFVDPRFQNGYVAGLRLARIELAKVMLNVKEVK